jgi:hypothetical protein
LAFSGNVASMGLDEVFGFLATNGLEGALTIVGAATSLRLYFREGRLLCPYEAPRTKSGRLKAARPTGASASKDSAERESGRLSRQALDDVFQRAAALQAEEGKGKKSGRIKTDKLQQMIKRAEGLRAERRRHTTERLHDVFTWGQARFEFEPGPVPIGVQRELEAGEVLVFDPTALLMEVAKRADERRRTPVSSAAEVAPPPGGKAIEGDLDGVGLAAVLQALRNHRRTGTLSVTARGREEQLFFSEGEVYALRTEEDSAFARFFLGDSWTDDMFDTMTNLTKAALDSPGQVDHSMLTAEELRAVKDQFLDLLFWEGAAFAFFQDQLPVEFHLATGERITRIALDTDKFLLEAIQRLMEWDGIRRVLGGGDAVPRFADLEWKLAAIRERDDAEFLTLIDGRQTFEDLVRVSGQQHLAVGRVLCELVDRGWMSLEASELPDTPSGANS